MIYFNMVYMKSLLTNTMKSKKSVGYKYALCDRNPKNVSSDRKFHKIRELCLATKVLTKFLNEQIFCSIF